jgi:cell division septation protein DedD
MVFGDQMRLSSLLYIGISALVVMACGEEEVKKAPKLKKAAKSLPKNAVNENLFQDMESLNGPAQQAKNKALAEAPTTRLQLSDNIPKPRQSGDYVLQAGVSDSKVLADILVNKIKRLGYEAYIVQVNDPAQLVGTYYRVRVGFFHTVTDARLFGHNVLKPESIGFWIDNSKNDNLGVSGNS